MRCFIVSTFAVVTLALPALGQATTWEIDPAHSSAQFAIRHLMVSTVRGDFRKVSGTVNLDDKDPTKSTVDATIDVSSINTGIEKRDNHLKSPDFFDVAKYPTMTFKSKKIQKAEGEEKFKVTGDLTLHGTTKEVVLDFDGNLKPIKDPTGKSKIGGTASTKLNRKDFGLTWNKALETGGVVVGDDVTVTIDLEMTQAEATASATPVSVSEATQKAAENAAGKVLDKAADKVMPNPQGK